ncbi:hypothetical protein EON76_01355 [bacterium]|nr:MAG: hypothetical protein EON76_01355 [bacterium]
MTAITVVGSGVVGAATGRGFAKRANATVTFVDVVDEKLQSLRDEGFNAIRPEELTLDGTDIVFVSVPTPTRKEDDTFVTDYLVSACTSIGRALERMDTASYPVIVFRSTMLCGTTSKVLIPILEKESRKQAGIDFGVCYNPEYLREFAADEDFASLEIVTIGHDLLDQKSAVILATAYEPFEATLHYLTIEEAEYQKYVHNLMNAVKISAYNEMRRFGESQGFDKDRIQVVFDITAETAESNTNPRYGLRDKGPYGGACLPKEVNATLSDAKNRGIHLPVLAATQEMNRALGGW